MARRKSYGCNKLQSGRRAHHRTWPDDRSDYRIILRFLADGDNAGTKSGRYRPSRRQAAISPPRPRNRATSGGSSGVSVMPVTV